MLEADAADTVFSGGRRYTVDVPIAGNARTAMFRFAYSDGTEDAVGDPALIHSLPITTP